MQFARMQEAGNDFVCVDCLSASPPGDPVAAGLEVSRRHAGHLLVLSRSERADARMDLYAADGSPMEGCGDGLRCAAKYLYESGLARKPRLAIESHRGTWYADPEVRGSEVARVRIDMGPPALEAARIPTRLPGNPPLEMPMTWPDTMHNVTCVGVGDPHAVIFVHQLTDQLVQGIGPNLESHYLFPLHTNVEFVKVNARNDVTVRVWGRGAGERPSSVSGACAVVVAGALTGRTDRRLAVHMAGGNLEVDWPTGGLNHIALAGPVVELGRGDWPAPA
jgi:diaminopimelate epimerase